MQRPRPTLDSHKVGLIQKHCTLSQGWEYRIKRDPLQQRNRRICFQKRGIEHALLLCTRSGEGPFCRRRRFADDAGNDTAAVELCIPCHHAHFTVNLQGTSRYCNLTSFLTGRHRSLDERSSAPQLFTFRLHCIVFLVIFRRGGKAQKAVSHVDHHR